MNPAARPPRRTFVAFAAAATLIGLALRLGLLSYSTEYGYLNDHDDFVRWGIQATDVGVLTLYERPPDPWLMRFRQEGRWVVRQRSLHRLCNYPPLSVYLLWSSGAIFKAVGDDRVINTETSRAAFVLWTVAADFLLALGCAAVVRRFRPGWPARAAYLLALLLPPLLWDSMVWGQVDSWALAPAVWMLWAMLERRWLLAGALYGVMAGLKTQAVLFVPLWGLAILLSRPFWKPLAGLGAAAAVLMAAAAPFTIHDRGLKWFTASYVENFTAYADYTTLKAFNLWYLDALIADSVDAHATLLGLSKNRWGRILLGAGLLAGFAAAWLRRRRDPRVLVEWAALSLVLFVMLPTQVHERYLVLALPFLLIAAMLRARFWPALLLLTLVALGQVTWTVWLPSSAGAFDSLYRRQMRQLAERRQEPPPGLSEALNRQRLLYRENREKTVAAELALTLAALAGAAATARAAVGSRGATSAPLAPAHERRD